MVAVAGWGAENEPTVLAGPTYRSEEKAALSKKVREWRKGKRKMLGTQIWSIGHSGSQTSLSTIRIHLLDTKGFILMLGIVSRYSH